MAGDSEQRLQAGHGQSSGGAGGSGGEPFLIGVSGGTASGKVSHALPRGEALSEKPARLAEDGHSTRA